jgi:phosphatidylinositol alpha-mannosyltransferase
MASSLVPAPVPEVATVPSEPAYVGAGFSRSLHSYVGAGFSRLSGPPEGGPYDKCSRGNRLRIAVISYNLPRPGFRRGGIERVAHDLADGLGRRGHTVAVYSHDPRPPGATYEVRPLPWKAFVSTWAGKRLTMGYLGNLLAILPRFADADVIMAHGDSLLLPLRRKPVVRVMHGSALDEARSATSIGRRVSQTGVYGLELLSALTQRHCVAVSANTRQSNPLIAHVIPNGVNQFVFHPEPGARAGHPMIVFVGALGGRKRGSWLLDQFTHRIRPRCPDAELHMVCEPGAAVAGVVYRTGLSDQELAALYRRAWVFASPSTYEGFGLPYLEAMASGTPVVATPNPGSREVLNDGAYGRLAADDDFASVICELLTDHAARETITRLGLERAAELSLERTLDSYESLLQTMVLPRA